MSLRDRYNKFAEGRDMGAAAFHFSLAFVFAASFAFTLEDRLLFAERYRVATVRGDIASQYKTSLERIPSNMLEAAVLDGIADRIEAGEKGIVNVPTIAIPSSEIEIDMGHAYAAGEEAGNARKDAINIFLAMGGVVALASAGSGVFSLRRKEEKPGIIEEPSAPRL